MRGSSARCKGRSWTTSLPIDAVAGSSVRSKWWSFLRKMMSCCAFGRQAGRKISVRNVVRSSSSWGELVGVKVGSSAEECRDFEKRLVSEIMREKFWGLLKGTHQG